MLAKSLVIFIGIGLISGLAFGVYLLDVKNTSQLVFVEGAGAVVNGQRLTALPPSVLTVLGSDQSGGGLTPLRNAIVREWSIPLDHVVSGSRVLTIDLGNKP